MAWTAPESYTLDQVIGVTEMHKIRDNMRELWHEVAYVEFTADVTVTTSATNPELTPLDIVSSGALTYVANPILIEFWAPGLSMNGAGGISLWDATTDLGRMMHASAVGENGSLYLRRRLTPTAASHTYKLRLWTPTASTNIVRAGVGGVGVNMPGHIRVLQRGG